MSQDEKTPMTPAERKKLQRKRDAENGIIHRTVKIHESYLDDLLKYCARRMKNKKK